MNGVPDYAIYAAVFAGVYALFAGGTWLWERRGSLIPEFKPSAATSDPIEASRAFVTLRRHFVLTAQPQRVAVLDEHVAAGVFATPDFPAKDAAKIVTTIKGE